MALVPGGNVTQVAKASDATGDLARLYHTKAVAELGCADRLVPGSDLIRWRGQPIAQVAVVKGMRGPAEASGNAAVSGADGQALERALAALGFDVEQVFYTLSAAVPDANPADRAARIRLVLEAVDAPLVIALDECAAGDIARALSAQAPKPGVLAPMFGRHVLVLSGFEASLSDEKAKRRVWKELRAASVLAHPAKDVGTAS